MFINGRRFQYTYFKENKNKCSDLSQCSFLRKQKIFQFNQLAFVRKENRFYVSY